MLKDIKEFLIKIRSRIKVYWYMINKWSMSIPVRTHKVGNESWNEEPEWIADDIMKVYDITRKFESGEYKVNGESKEYVDLMLVADEKSNVFFVILYK